MLELRGCQVDLDRRQVHRDDGEVVALTDREAALLAYLSERPGMVVSRQTLLEEVWRYASTVISRASDSTVARLREKIERDPANPAHVLTVHGEGYRFEPALAPTETIAAQAASEKQLWVGPTRVDLWQLRAVRGDGNTVELKHSEAELLRALANQPGEVVSRGDLIAAIGGRGGRTVDNIVRQLRAKLEPSPGEPAWLLTARGRGYRLLPAHAEAPAPQVALVLCEVRGVERIAAATPELVSEAVECATRCLRAVSSSAYFVPGTAQLAFAFPTAAAALIWCDRAQRELLTASWAEGLMMRPEATAVLDVTGNVLYRGPRVAMAAHFGFDPPVRGASGAARYSGPVAARVQRVLSDTPGGQIRVTDEVWQDAATDIKRLFAFRNLGAASTAGAQWALVPEALASRGLPSRRARASVSGVEATTSFVGRERELAEIHEWRNGNGRLLTLLGPGGVGKTRLATRFAAAFPGEVWWCGLDAATNAEQALARLAAVFGLPDADTARIGRVMQLRRATVVLDNVEQVPQLDPVLTRLLQDAPDAQFVVTSRRLLGLEGEVVLEVGPLSESAARLLFEDRAQQTYASALTRETVDQLVERLDRLPLAIELAAGRLGVLSPKELLARMPLQILAGPGQGRHATMRAALDWSWDLALPWERLALAQLSVFRSSFTAADAEAVVLLPADAPSVLDVLERLRAQSLVRREVTRAGPRLRLLQSVRDYAAERRDGEIAARHAARMATYGTADALLSTRHEDGAQRLFTLFELLPDLLGAAAYALEKQLAPEAAACALAVARVTNITTKQYAMVVRLLSRVHELAGLEVSRRVDVLATRASAHAWLGDFEQVAVHARAALALDPTCGAAWQALGRSALTRGQPDEAIEAFQNAIVRATDRAAAGVARGSYARALLSKGEADEALAACRVALADLRAVQNEWELVYQQTLEGYLLRHLGRHNLARLAFEAAIPQLDVLGDLHGAGSAHRSLALIAHEDGELERAMVHIELSIRCHNDTGMSAAAAMGWAILAAIHHRLGDSDRGDRCAARASSLPWVKDFDRAVVHANLAEAALEAGRPAAALEHVTEARLADQPRWYQAGLQRVEAEARHAAGLAVDTGLLQGALGGVAGGVERVRAHCLSGLLAADAGELDEARAALAEAERLAGARGALPQTATGRVVHKLRERLGVA